MKSRKKAALPLMLGLVLACTGIASAETENEMKTVMDVFEAQELSLAESYKKPGENNPLYTQRFGADPGVMEYNGRVYVYMTDDLIEYDRAGNVKENSYSKIKCISCISSDDMVNWTDHGKIEVAAPKGKAKWAVNSWAPCAAHKEMNGKEKFFLYFCNGGNSIGALCADSPTGPWRDEVGHSLINRDTPECADVLWLFDPAVMVDEDGTGYLAFGGGVPEGMQEAPGTGRIVRLGDDMISLDGAPMRLEVPWLFEDSGLNRIGDTYIYSYCSNWQTKGNSLGLGDGAIQYMTSDDPLGPYAYQGELFPNEGRFFGLYGNNHHSIACLDGAYYLFYHSRPVEQAMGITGNYRSPQADRIVIEEDGSLRSVVGTMKGIEQLKPFDPYRPIQASTMSDQAGISVEGCGEEAVVTGGAGAWLKVSGADFADGCKALVLTAGSEDGCTVYVTRASAGGEIMAELEIPAQTENLTSFEAPLALSGMQDLFFVFSGDIRFASWEAIRR